MFNHVFFCGRGTYSLVCGVLKITFTVFVMLILGMFFLNISRSYRLMYLSVCLCIYIYCINE